MASYAFDYERFYTEVKNRGPAFRYGLSAPYFRRYTFEDREYISNEEFSKYFKGGYPIPPDETLNFHQNTMRFLKQVRESNGYDVDCHPHPCLFSPFGRICMDTVDEYYRDSVIEATQFAIDKINAATGKSYVLVKFDKVVGTTCTLLFLTLIVKEEGDSSQLKTIRALVNMPYGVPDETHPYLLLEWMYKPSAEDSESLESNVKNAGIVEGRGYLIELKDMHLPIFEHILSYIDDKSAVKLASTCKSLREICTTNVKPLNTAYGKPLNTDEKHMV